MILLKIKNEALKAHIEKFDKWKVNSDAELAIDPKDMKIAYDKLDDKLRSALHLAYDRIKAYHQNNFQSRGWILKRMGRF